MKTTCDAFKRFDKAADLLDQDKQAAQRYTAFVREETERLIAAGAERNLAIDLTYHP